MSLLISALFMLLNVAIILLISYVILWVVRDWFGVTIDPMVFKFCQVVVGLLCLIIVVIWLAGIMGGTSYRLPFG